MEMGIALDLVIFIALISTAVSQSPNQRKTAESPEIGSEKSDEISNEETIEKLPDEIIQKIFKKLPFYYLRQSLALSNKRLRDVAYSKEVHPTELKLVYDGKHTDDICFLVQSSDQVINFDAYKTLDITVNGAVDDHDYLINFANRNDIQFGDLEYLKINMAKTNSMQKSLLIFTKLLEKTRTLVGFSLNLNKMSSVGEISDDETAVIEFWKALRDSKAKDVEFAVTRKYDGRTRSSLEWSNVRFLLHIFIQHPEVYLENLRKITMKFHSSAGTKTFLNTSVKNSYNTLQEINIEFDYLVSWMDASEENMFKQLSNCKSLQKLIVNFPIAWSTPRHLNTNKEKSTWNAIIMKIVNRRQDFFFGLLTNIGYLHDYGFLEHFNVNFKNKVPLKYMKLILTSSKRNYQRDVAEVLKNCPKLEILKISCDLFADTNSIQFFFKWAMKLKKIKEFTVSYHQSFEIAFPTNVYQEILHLVRHSYTIIKITVKIVMRDDKSEAPKIRKDKSKTKKEKQIEIEALRLEYLKAHVLNVPPSVELKNLFGNMFNVEYKLASKFFKDDTHVIILQKKS